MTTQNNRDREGDMKTALQRLRDLWAVGDCRRAVKLAASWRQLGEHRDRITRGSSAISYPDIYREMGHDPGALFADACVALCERYQLDGEASR